MRTKHVKKIAIIIHIISIYAYIYIYTFILYVYLYMIHSSTSYLLSHERSREQNPQVPIIFRLLPCLYTLARIVVGVWQEQMGNQP